VANANFRGTTVDWYIKADDIVLKNKGGKAGNPQNNAPQGQQKR
ncbi:TPA: conjugal transfer protein, partial [Clostridioides difficile]